MRKILNRNVLYFYFTNLSLMPFPFLNPPQSSLSKIHNFRNHSSSSSNRYKYRNKTFYSFIDNVIILEKTTATKQNK